MALDDLCNRVEELKSEIDKLRPIKPEQERRILDKFRLDWNYHSNAIEGNQLSLGETKVLILEGLTANGKPLKDSLDIKGHNEVLVYLEGFVQRKEQLDESTIRGLHKVLLHEPYQVEARTPEGKLTRKWVKLGEYKSEPNFALSPTGEERHFILPQDTPAKMQELMAWYKENQANKSLSPVVFAAEFHHRFVRIHPFDDGNGRMGRILMNLILMQNGYQPVIIKTDSKEKYIAALVKADVGEMNDLYEIIANEEIQSEELFLKGARGEDIADFDDIDKKIAILKKELSNVEVPVEVSPAVLTELFVTCIKPLLVKTVKKLSQFDELYSRCNLTFSSQYVLNNTLRMFSSSNLDESLPQYEQVLKTVDRVTNLVCSVHWDGFKKAGLNTFQDQCNIVFNFDKLQYSVQVGHTMGNVFQTQKIYPHKLTEQETEKIIIGLAEACLIFIEKNVRKTK